MSLTPPKFVAELRKRDQDDLLARLRALGNEWTRQASEEEYALTASTLAACALALHAVLDDHAKGTVRDAADES